MEGCRGGETRGQGTQGAADVHQDRRRHLQGARCAGSRRAAATRRRLGARARELGPLPLPQKRKEREKKALELAFETGMATRKGRGKEKKRERDAKRDRGLQELHGYSDGMLRVSPSVFKTRTREDAGGGTRGLGSAFGLRGVGKGPRPKAKGKKKGKGSKKRR